MERNTRFFLVDDDRDDQEIFTMALHEVSANIEVSVAGNGLEALEKLTQNTTYIPDFIFIDINMHKMNGVECLREIKKLAHLEKSRVVMFSTSDDPKIIHQCKELGADEFLAKPPGLMLLVEWLRKFI